MGQSWAAQKCLPHVLSVLPHVCNIFNPAVCHYANNLINYLWCQLPRCDTESRICHNVTHSHAMLVPAFLASLVL
jgi:hypothetical protein